jgi:hypothetical protein
VQVNVNSFVGCNEISNNDRDFICFLMRQREEKPEVGRGNSNLRRIVAQIGKII